MEAKDVKIDFKWDQERLGDFGTVIDKHGVELASPVIQKLNAKIRRCISSVEEVVPHLMERNILTLSTHEELKNKSTKPTGLDLTAYLTTASQRDLGEGKELIKNLYLALLDAFLDTHDRGCHALAMLLRETALGVLKERGEEIPTEPRTARDIIERFPEIIIQGSVAKELRWELKLPPHSIEIINLKFILNEYVLMVGVERPINHEWLFPLVEAMMLTQGAGRYVSLLLPFYLSYQANVYLFLVKLGEKWADFALYLGFTSYEINEIRHLSFDQKSEIINFSKVWRMPDLGQENTNILQSVMRKANIGMTDIMTPSESRKTLSVEFEECVIVDGERYYSRQTSRRSTDSPVSIKREGSFGSHASSYRASYAKRGTSGSSDRGSLEQSFERCPSEATDAESMIEVPAFDGGCSIQGDDDDSNSASNTSQHPLSPPTQQQFSQNSKKLESMSLHVPSLSQANYQEPSFPNFKAEEEITTGSSLGSGLYGEVHRVKHGDEHYAAKEYRIGTLDSKEFQEKIMKLRHHENLVRYFGICCIENSTKDPKPSVVVMEYVSHTLVSVDKKVTGDLESNIKLSILAQVATGLAHLHSHSITHSDLVPSNILMETQPTYRVKISDYANSLVMPISEALDQRQVGSNVQDYLSPETHEGDISDKADVFSFGHLILFVVLQREPHPLKNATHRIKGKLIPRTEVERREEFFNEMANRLEGSKLEPLIEWAKKALDDETVNRPEIKQFSDKFKV